MKRISPTLCRFLPAGGSIQFCFSAALFLVGGPGPEALAENFLLSPMDPGGHRRRKGREETFLSSAKYPVFPSQVCLSSFLLLLDYRQK